MPAPRSALQPNPRTAAALLTALLLVGSFAGGLPVAASSIGDGSGTGTANSADTTNSTATTNSTSTASSGASDHVAVEQDEFNTTRGALIELPIRVPAGTEAELFLQRTTMAVTSRAVVRDGGDGRIRVVLNTFDGTWSVVNETDGVVSQDPTPSRKVLPAAYEFTVSTDDRAAFARVNVRPRPLHRVAAWQTTTPPVDLADTSDVRTAIADGDLVRAEAIEEHDSIVLQLDAPGLDGALASMPGANTSARFRHLFATHGTLVFEQTNPAASRMQATIDVLNNSGVTIHPDVANDTYYVELDLSAVRVNRGDDPDPDFEFHDAEFVANVALDANTNLSADGERLAAFVKPRQAWVVDDPDKPLDLTAASGQLVNGTTTVGTGWNVTLVLRGVDDESTPENESFVRRTTVTVVSPLDSSHNRFQATFDLTDIVDTTDATIDVRFDGQSILDDPIDARIESPTPDTTTTTTTDPSTTTATTTTTTTTTTAAEPATNSTTSPDRTAGPVPGPGILGALLAVVAGLGLLARMRD